MTWQIITGEYPPVIGGVSGYSQIVAEGLADAGDEVHVWCPPLPHLPASNGVTVHPALGRISRRDLRAVDRLLDRFPPPRRLLVQWVPHGFGYRSMNVGFCTWLLRRARRGDRIEIMVHEPYLGFGEGGIRWTAAASVHRVMTIILARAASRVWIAIPQWERRWRPYALGRNVPFAWLPIPSSLPMPAPEDVRRVRDRYAPAGGPIVGHLSSYGTVATRALSVTVPAILQRTPNAAVVLLGQHGERFHQQLVRRSSAARRTDSRDGHALSAGAGGSHRRVRPADSAVSRRHQQPPDERDGRPRARHPGDHDDRHVSPSLSGRRRARSHSSASTIHTRSRLKRCDCCRTTARAVTSGRGAMTSTASTSIFVTPSARSVAQPQRSRAHRHPELDQPAGRRSRLLPAHRDSGARPTRPRRRLLARTRRSAGWRSIRAAGWEPVVVGRTDRAGARAGRTSARGVRTCSSRTG